MTAKYFVLIAALLVLEVHCQELEELPSFVAGRPEIQRKGRTVRVASAVCLGIDNAFQTFCNDDAGPCNATGVIACNGLGTDVGALEFNCTGSTPYCSEKTVGNAGCSSVKPDTCDATADFKCTGKGIFPSALSCKKYYYCKYNATTGTFSPQSFTCPNLYTFDPSDPNGDYCRMTNNNYCITAKCTIPETNVPLVYPYFPKTLGQYVVRCKNVTETPEVFRCDASFDVVPDTYPVKCEVACKGTERIAHPILDTKYYQCRLVAGRYEGQLLSCLGDMKFDRVKKLCV